MAAKKATIQSIHSFLVRPGKNLDKQPPIRGARVPAASPVYTMAAEVFDGSATECKFEIAFNDTEGKQENLCRTLVQAFLKTPGMKTGRAIAARLQSVTTGRSGMGLLFLVLAQQDPKRILLLSRFPSNPGVTVDDSQEELSVDFIERVFLKNASAYKAALYAGRNAETDFWEGRAIDRQLSGSDIAISNYWIREFLASDFRTPGAAGTRRFALALKEAVKTTPSAQAKQELVALAQLVRGLDGKPTSGADIAKRFQLGPEATESLKGKLGRLDGESFMFSAPEYGKHILYRTMELDNDAMLTAPADKFDDVFRREAVEPRDGADRRERFSTVGRVTDQRLKKERA